MTTLVKVTQFRCDAVILKQIDDLKKILDTSNSSVVVREAVDTLHAIYTQDSGKLSIPHRAGTKNVKWDLQLKTITPAELAALGYVIKM